MYEPKKSSAQHAAHAKPKAKPSSASRSVPVRKTAGTVKFDTKPVGRLAPQQGRAVSGSKKVRKKSRHSVAVQILSVLVSMVMCIVSVLMVYFGVVLSRVRSETIVTSGVDLSGIGSGIDLPGLDPGVNEPQATSDITNILLIGVDTRSTTSFSGLSDSMIVMSINRIHKEIRLLSFLRDTYVRIPTKNGIVQNKMNAAYATGGFQRLADTFKLNFGLTLDKYIVVNFTGLADIVDAVGGLDVPISEAESHYIALKPGTYAPPDPHVQRTGDMTHLTGFQTVEYARIRHLDSDFVRTQRQQTVLNLLFNKVKTQSLPTIQSVLNTTLKYVSTNMTEGELVSLAITGFSEYSKYKVVTGYHVPEDGDWHDVMDPKAGDIVVLNNPTATAKKMLAYLYS